MAAVTAAAVTAGAGIYSAHKAGKQADKALSAQDRATQAQLELGREQLAWSKDVYNQWREEFDPILGELKQEAMAGRTPDYAAIAADTMATFDSARGQERRQLTRYGVNPSSGGFGANERRYGIGAASAEVNARQAARRGAEGERFGKLSQVYGLGSNLQSAAMGQIPQAYGAMQGAYGNQAYLSGQRAGMYGDAAQAGMRMAFGQDWGNILGNAFGSGGGGGGSGLDEFGLPWAGTSGPGGG